MPLSVLPLTEVAASQVSRNHKTLSLSELFVVVAEIDGLLDEIRYSEIHRCGPVQDEVNELDVKVTCPKIYDFKPSEVSAFHSIFLPNMQFCHSVYVKAFSRKIFSVWITVVCLSKKLA